MSRTIMLPELVALLAATPPGAGRGDYAAAIVETNCLSKATSASRRLSKQRLHELYALDPAVPMFRVLRRLWDLDAAARPLLALCCALARDPLLMATVPSVLPLQPGAMFLRDMMTSRLSDLVADRLNEDVLDKVVRNAASSWTQSGHLEGRRIKKRSGPGDSGEWCVCRVPCGRSRVPRPRDLHFIVVRGTRRAASTAHALLLEAKRLGLIDLRLAGDVVELDVGRLAAPPVER